MSKQADARQIINQFIQDEQLPAEYAAMAVRYFLPLSEELAVRAAQYKKTSGQALIIGVNGAQGTGKSTLSALLKQLLQARQLACVVISIDDLYLTQTERIRLAHDVHPLLKTRGVPGTHDLDLGLAVLAELSAAGADAKIRIPRFNKALDERCPQAQWEIHAGAADVILLEGWCVGARPVSLTGKPINELEQEQDANGIWREFIEAQLQAYQRLFQQINILIMLKAPDMESIVAWRTLQEQKLSAKTADSAQTAIMNEAALRRFIMHYERLTRHMLNTMPDYADVVFELDTQHQIINARYHKI